MQTFPSATVYQTANWARYYEQEFKKKPIFSALYNRSSGEIAGVCLCFINSKRSSVSWLNAPLIKPIEESGLSFPKALGLLFDFLKQKGVGYISESSLPLTATGLRCNNYLGQIGSRISYWGNYIISLQQGENGIWNQFHSSVRKNVKKCMRMGIDVIRLISIEEVMTCYLPLLIENRKRMGFNLPPTYPNFNLWNSLYRKDGCICEVFIAIKKDEPLAGLGIIGYNGRIEEIAVAQSYRCFSEKIPAQDLVKWEIIKWGIVSNFYEYSLGGVAPFPSNSKEDGIKRFKSKFGGEYITYPIISKILSHPKFYTLNIDRFLISKIKDLKRRLI